MGGLNGTVVKAPVGRVAARVASCLMPPRPGWNRMGPRLPAWFAERLREIDPAFTLQFMPPRSPKVPAGCDPRQFPHGVWVVCQRLRHTRWLFAKWVYRLATPDGRQELPRRDLLRMLKYARSLHRHGEAQRLVERFAHWVREVEAQRSKAAKRQLLARIEAAMRKLNMTDRVKPAVFLSSAVPGARRRSA